MFQQPNSVINIGSDKSLTNLVFPPVSQLVN